MSEQSLTGIERGRPRRVCRGPRLVVQFLGLIRWPFLVPYLARVAREAEPDSAAGQAVDVVFQSFNRYLGVAVGEHLGYAFTGLWSILAGVALIDSSVTADWLGAVGVLIGPLFLICSLEFVGRVDDTGWKVHAPAGARYWAGDVGGERRARAQAGRVVQRRRRRRSAGSLDGRR